MKRENVFANSKKSDEDLRKLYEKAKEECEVQNEDLDVLFNAIMQDKKNYFPNQQKEGELECLKSWIKKYIKKQSEISGLSTEKKTRKKTKKKGTCSDYAMAVIVGEIYDLTEEDLVKMEQGHKIFMSVESLQGDILEKFIAQEVKDYGWIWCVANSVHAADFCRKSDLMLLQVKNKYNSENSSSSDVREGTDIVKWNRLKMKMEDGIPKARPQWDKLNEIINGKLESGKKPCNMNEEKYIEFLKKELKDNYDAICERLGGAYGTKIQRDNSEGI